MDAKLFEIRDSLTMIPALAVRISAADGYLARHAGYQTPCVLLTRLLGGKACYDVYEWCDRTMSSAHRFIEENWDNLMSGAVVDVEHILGETAQPKRSESEEVGIQHKIEP
ncbi:MAG: hypothetical protein ACRDQZ_22795 [Mycobacteriales bacterium]